MAEAPALALVAHRGYAADYPENTLIALEAARIGGARYVEIDVQLSRDGVPLLFHDRTLDRLCGVSGAVHERTLNELRGLHASFPERFGARHAGNPLCTLTEFSGWLASHPEVRAFVEIKRVALEQHGQDRVIAAMLLALRPVQDRCVLISYDLDALAACRRACPLPLGFVADDWHAHAGDAVRALKPEYFFCDIEGLPPQGQLDLPGAQVAVFEVPDLATAHALARRGVALFESFALPEWIATTS